MTRDPRIRALLLATAASLTLAACGGDDETQPANTSPATAADTTATPTATTAAGPRLGPAFGSMDALPGVLKTPPPWDANAGELQQRLRAIGLPALTAEGEVVHIHQHLDLYDAGEAVPVASDFGIAADQTFISPLHTHAPRAGQPPNG